SRLLAEGVARYATAGAADVARHEAGAQGTAGTGQVADDASGAGYAGGQGDGDVLRAAYADERYSAEDDEGERSENAAASVRNVAGESAGGGSMFAARLRGETSSATGIIDA